ncbi:MAG: hypothetical protein GF330_00415 [Candidatus Eisenbacteria bacterium]|nr:hypothetical protein [Candidatus Eisenbacteria bacterium]
MGHLLFEPRNVAGRPGYRTWINSYALPWRKTLDVGLVDGIVLGYDIQMQADALALAGGLRDPDDPETLVEDVATLFFGQPPTIGVRQRMIDELLGGMQPGEWHLGLPKAEARVQALLRLTMRLPDFQLK